MIRLKTLREIISQNRIHSNTSIGTLKSIAKNHGVARFVIDSENKLHAGSAHHFYHDEIYPPNKNYENKNTIYGFVSHDKKNDKFTYSTYRNSDKSNSILNSMEKIHKMKVVDIKTHQGRTASEYCC